MSHQAPHQPAGRLAPLVAALLTLVFLAVLVRTAWLSDDALISLRTVLNVTNGFGLTFNIGERVQTFTHPLWLGVLTLAYLLVGNVFYGTFAAAMACSAAAFWLAVRHATTAWHAVLAAVVLLWSRAFVDFSTSGLENPLAYLLLAIFVGVFLRHWAPEPVPDPRAWLTRLWTLGGLLYLTRPDAVLLALPMLAVASWRVRRLRTVSAAAALGLLPPLAWTLFSIVYYGFPFPNTAYAKLATGIPSSEMRAQGVVYLLDSLDRDPITLTAVAFALLVAFRLNLAARALAGGLALYLLYVISIGGDFMAGRFVAVPLFGAVLLLSRMTTMPRPVMAAATLVLMLVGSMSSHVPLWSNSSFADSAARSTGIVDERGVYFGENSLVRATRTTFRNPNWPSGDWRLPDIPVVDTCGLMGTGGIKLGAYVYLLDECALADPLLARLPSIYNPTWRPGHYLRYLPPGYRRSVETGTNVIEDPKLREYYEHLRLIVRSDALFSSDRLRTIVAMNRGVYDHLIDRSIYRHAGRVAPIADVAAPRDNGTPWDAEGNRILDRPLAVTVDDRPGRRYLHVSLDSDDGYALTFLKRGEIVDRLELGPVPEHRRQPGLVGYTVDLPPGAREKGFDTILVSPIAGNDRFAMGHLLVEGVDEGSDARLHRHVAERDGVSVR